MTARNVGGTLVVAALMFLAPSCRQVPERPPIILISVDTLRSDRLPMYGYRGNSTPALDALRRDSILFRNAWSHSPLTLPSHASMFTGTLPAAHGVRDNTGFRLAAETPNVVSLLRSHGYATGAAVSAFVLRKATGMNTGFDAYDDELEPSRSEKSLGRIQRAGRATETAARRWIDSHAQQPFFYFLHLYEPHAPYEPTYDADVARADAAVGSFLSYLKQKGIYDRALIVFVSDHGEGLGDHGEDEHGIFLYRETIAVPFLVKLPQNALAGSSSDTTVGLFDLAPTLLRAAGLDVPASMQGLPLFDGDRLARVEARAIYAETYYPRLHFGWSDLHSVVEGTEHFIDAPRAELYDLATDAQEKVNLVDQRRRRVAALRKEVARQRSEPLAPSAVSKEEMEKLAALGYIGSTAHRGEGPLADPKDKIGTFRQLQDAFRLARARKDEEALEAFDRLLETESEMVDLWDVRSKVLLRLGRTREGIDSAKEALRRNPAATHIAADLANALLLAGELDDARAHAELALRSDPAKAEAILARVALAKGDLATAEAHARRSIAAGGDVGAARYALALVQQRRGDHAAVLETTSQIGQPPPRGLGMMRGDALARLGREAEAEAAFRSELAAYADSAEAARRLVLLLVAQGRNEEATRVIRDLADASPEPRTYRAIAETLRIVGDAAGERYWNSRAKEAS